MDSFTLPKALTRRLDRVARETHTRSDALVRDAIKGHLDYLEWLQRSLDEAEREGARDGWLSGAQVSSMMRRRRVKLAK